MFFKKQNALLRFERGTNKCRDAEFTAFKGPSFLKEKQMSNLLYKILEEALTSTGEANLNDLSLGQLIDLCKELDVADKEELYGVFDAVENLIKPLQQRANKVLVPLIEKAAA